MSVEQIVGDWLQGNITEPSTSELEADSVVRAEDSVEDSYPTTDIQEQEQHESDEESGLDNEKDPASEEAEKAPEKQVSGDVETVVISDDSGRRQVKVDFSDRDKLKKYVQLAYGARKWQAERDKISKEVEPLRGQLAEMRSNWDTLESTFRRGGIEGVIDLLEGRQGAYQEHLKSAMERAEFLRKASPEELQAFKAEELARTKAREAEDIRKEFEDLRNKVERDKEEADYRKLESQVTPLFQKYRFAGKLGDESDENMFDEMLWTTVTRKLQPYEDQYDGILNVPQEIVEKQFREVAQSIRKRIGAQAERKASRVLEQKKQEATENVQAKVRAGHESNGLRKEADGLIKSGNLTSLLQNWGKYSNAFRK